MPEAAVHENSQSAGGKTNVRFAGSFAPVYPVTAQAVVPEGAPEQEFGLCIPAFVAAHIPAYLFLGCEWCRLCFMFLDFFSDGQLRRGMLYTQTNSLL